MHLVRLTALLAEFDTSLKLHLGCAAKEAVSLFKSGTLALLLSCSVLSPCTTGTLLACSADQR